MIHLAPGCGPSREARRAHADWCRRIGRDERDLDPVLGPLRRASRERAARERARMAEAERQAGEDADA